MKSTNPYSRILISKSFYSFKCKTSNETGRQQIPLKKQAPTMKFVCPKMKWEYNREDKSKRRVCHCDNPCITSSCGRMIYVYPEKNLRAYPGVERGSKEWNDTYKIRVNVEKSINHFKDSFCVANRKTANEKTLHADLLLAGITQLLTVVVADKMNQRQFIRSLKSFIAQDLPTQ